MEPFSILCDTCTARLKVRQVAAIGQKLSCPKCHNMILVLPPRDWQPPAEVADEVQKRIELANLAADSFDFDDIEHILSQSPADKPTVPSPTIPVDNSSRQHPTPSRRPPTPASPRQPASPSPSGDDGPMLPTGKWTTAETRARRKWLIVGATALGAFVLVAAIIGAMIANRSGDQADTAANQTVENDPSEDQHVMDSGEPTSNNGEDTESGSDNDSGSEDDTGTENDTPANAGSAGAGNDDDPITEKQPGEPGTSSPPSVQAPAMTDSPPPIESTPPPIEPADPSLQDMRDDSAAMDSGQQQPPLAENPLGGAPRIDDENPGNDQAPKAKGFDDLLNEHNLTGGDNIELPELGKLESLLDDAGTTVMEMKDLASAHRDQGTVGLSKYFIAKPEPVEIDVDRQLNLELGAIKFEGQPLLDMLRTLQFPIGIPFHIDTYSWQSKAIPFDVQVDIFLRTKSPLTEALDSAFAEHQLAHSYDASTGCISVHYKDAFLAEESEFELPAAIPAEKREQLVQEIKGSIVPDYWVRQQEPGAITLKDNRIHVTAYPVVQMRIENLLQKLAAVATLNANADAEASKTLQPRYEQSTVLSAPSNLGVSVDMPLSWFLMRLQQKSGAVVLVDWASLLAEDWNLKAEVPGDLVEPTVEEVISRLARAMKLTWRVVDEQTIELTTFESAAQKTDLEVYDCKSILDRGVEVDELKEFVFFNLLGGEIQSTPFVWVFYQEDLQCFVVIAPQFLQRQINTVMNRLKQK